MNVALFAGFTTSHETPVRKFGERGVGVKVGVFVGVLLGVRVGDGLRVFVGVNVGVLVGRSHWVDTEIGGAVSIPCDPSPVTLLMVNVTVPQNPE